MKAMLVEIVKQDNQNEAYCTVIYKILNKMYIPVTYDRS